MTGDKSIQASLGTLEKSSPDLFRTTPPITLPTLRSLYGLLVLVLVPGSFTAQAQVNLREAAAPQVVPEEIIVTLPKSLTQLRREVYKAETRVFDVFNELNDDLQYDIKCEMENRRGTRMKVRVCKPNYYRFAMAEEAGALARKFTAFLEGMPTTPGQGFHLPTPSLSMSSGPGTAAIPHKDKKMERLVRTAIAVSPEFVEAIREYSIINDYYEEQREARFED